MTTVGLDTRGGAVSSILTAGMEADARGDDAVVLLDHADAPDQLVLLAALAPRTSRIRLVAHVDASSTHPYTFARKLVALDKLSGGRAGWHVTDDNAARRDEFIDLTTRLVVSWESDALVADKTSGLYVDTDRVAAVHHDGTYYSVHAPLDVGRGPQGVPPQLSAPVSFGPIP